MGDTARYTQIHADAARGRESQSRAGAGARGRGQPPHEHAQKFGAARLPKERHTQRALRKRRVARTACPPCARSTRTLIVVRPWRLSRTRCHVATWVVNGDEPSHRGEPQLFEGRLCRGPRDTRRVVRVARDTAGYARYHEIPRDITRYPQILPDVSKNHVTAQDFIASPRIGHLISGGTCFYFAFVLAVLSL